MTMLILLGPAIEDSVGGTGVLGGVGRSRLPVRRPLHLRLGYGLAARTLARFGKQHIFSKRLMEGSGMILINLAIGLLIMMGCLILQITFALWSVRYAVRRTDEAESGMTLLAGIRTLLMAMVIMMLGNFLQIMLWGSLFFWLGEFTDFHQAVYHSGVNFTSLGYGDVVMSTDRKLLGPLEALNGILMLGLTSAALLGILQHLTRNRQHARNRRY